MWVQFKHHLWVPSCPHSSAGCPGLGQDPLCLCATRSCNSSILLGRDAAKKDFIPWGQIFAKDQGKTYLAPQFRSAVVFREGIKPLRSYLPTPARKDTYKSPLGSGESQATPLDTDEVAACFKQLGFSSVFFPISY